MRAVIGDGNKVGKIIGWVRSKSDTIFGRKKTSAKRVTLSGWNWRNGGSTHRATSSETVQANVMATRKMVVRERKHPDVVASGLKGEWVRH